MTDIEKKLMERGISREEIESFAKLDNHNGKKDKFRIISRVSFASEFMKYSDGKFLAQLAAVLHYEANKYPKIIERVNSPRQSMKYQLLANEILGTLCEKKYSTREKITLNELYSETIKRIDGEE